MRCACEVSKLIGSYKARWYYIGTVLKVPGCPVPALAGRGLPGTSDILIYIGHNCNKYILDIIEYL